MKSLVQIRRLMLLVALIGLTACAGFPKSAPSAAPVARSESQTALISGELIYSGDLIDDRSSNTVMLLDLYGFIRRDHTYQPALSSQVLGPLKLNAEATRGAFTLRLPAVPGGEFADLDQNGQTDQGVQVFNLIWWPNETGGPFADGDDQIAGWGQTYASTIADPDTDGEIIGGKIVIWAPDGNQGFPTDFGPDQQLFTADDPIGALPPGYTVVDLDKHPFVYGRSVEEHVLLYEPSEYATKNFRGLSYTQAFDKLVEQVRQSYAFDGMIGKAPQWESLVPPIAARIEQAEQDHDKQAFYLALREFTYAFHDGHVALFGGDLEDDAFDAEFGGGYGFAAQELDDGRFIVSYVLEGSPAEQAGMQIGAEFTRFHGQPVADALAAVRPFSAPFSTAAELRYQRLRYLLRAPVGTSAELSFANPDQAEQTHILEAIAEQDSFDTTSILAGLDSWMLPVESWYIDDQVGNILVGTSADDTALSLQLFERALSTFESEHLPGIVIDLRQDSGGQIMGLAGFFSDQPIVLAQEFQRDSVTGAFEPRGAPAEVLPKGRTFMFDKIVVLVGFGCASACEAEAYALSQLPNVVVVGQYPTAGTYASVIGHEYLLPEKLTLQFSKWRYQLPDGSLFLEGQGVAPTRRVPVTTETVLSKDDPLRKVAIDTILGD